MQVAFSNHAIDRWNKRFRKHSLAEVFHRATYVSPSKLHKVATRTNGLYCGFYDAETRAVFLCVYAEHPLVVTVVRGFKGKGRAE